MQKPAIIEVLESAQIAHQSGDFVNALSFYEHFFDHALEDDPYALYGVRLNHCLNGWAELAEVFPGAKHRLEVKKRELLQTYLDERDPERFHDYLCVSRVLGTESDALEQFLSLHHSEPKSAAKLSKFIWNDLLNAEQWQACNDLLERPEFKLDELFAVFDEAARMKDVDPAFDDIKFDQHIVDTLLSDIQNLVNVLRHANRNDEINDLARQFQLGLEQRSHSLLIKQAHARSAFLFSQH